MKRALSRALVALVAASAVALPGIATSTTPAHAAGSCSLIVPSKVTIKQRFQEIPVKLGRDCVYSDTAYAAWYGIHPTEGTEEVLIFDDGLTEYWDLYSFDPVGRWTWRPSHSYDTNYDSVSQNRPTSDVRYGSKVRLSVTKSKTRVAFAASGTRYSGRDSAFVNWKGATGRIYYRAAGNKNWHGLKDVKLDSAGRFSWAYLDGKTREYKLVMWPQSTVWGSESSVVKR